MPWDRNQMAARAAQELQDGPFAGPAGGVLQAPVRCTGACRPC
jgi:hypothetical protein